MSYYQNINSLSINIINNYQCNILYVMYEYYEIQKYSELILYLFCKEYNIYNEGQLYFNLDIKNKKVSYLSLSKNPNYETNIVIRLIYIKYIGKDYGHYNVLIIN